MLLLFDVANYNYLLCYKQHFWGIIVVDKNRFTLLIFHLSLTTLNQSHLCKNFLKHLTWNSIKKIQKFLSNRPDVNQNIDNLRLITEFRKCTKSNWLVYEKPFAFWWVISKTRCYFWKKKLNTDIMCILV